MSSRSRPRCAHRAGRAAGQLSSSHGVSLARHRPGVHHRGWKADRAAQAGQSFRRICENNEIRAIKVHHLRHAVGSLLKDLGVPLASARRLVLLEHEQALHAIAAILIEHETIDREQFGRLRQSEPEETALAPFPRPEQATTSETARKRRTRPTAAGAAKHLPSALVARAVQPEDL